MQIAFSEVCRLLECKEKPEGVFLFIYYSPLLFLLSINIIPTACYKFNPFSSVICE